MFLSKEKALTSKKPLQLSISKDSFRIVVTLVAHFDLALHQMDVKIVSLNGNFEEEVIWSKSKGYMGKGDEHLGVQVEDRFMGWSKHQGNSMWNLIWW